MINLWRQTFAGIHAKNPPPGNSYACGALWRGKLEVLGSYVHSEQKKESDLDFLVTFKEDPNLLTFIAIGNYLSDVLGIKVDLVMKDSLKPRIGQQILGEAITV